MASNPPQLELQLGHPGFKRSFQQFGLDVDDVEEFESLEGAGSSAASRSGSAGSSSGSASGSSTMASGSSTGYTSSQSGSGSAEGYGRHHGHGHAANERNKRPRSEGPDSSNMGNASLSQSSGSSSGSSSSERSYTTAPLDVEEDGNNDEARERDRRMASPTSPQATPTYLTGFRHILDNDDSRANSGRGRNNNDAPSTLSFPLDFGPPPTPSIAEFAASRSTQRTVNGATTNIPGFSGMLSPRSSSPAPPPMLDIDMPMRESIEDDVDLRPYTIQSHESGAPHSQTDDGLQDATDRLRSAIQRAQDFDRTLAPLRNDTTAESSRRGIQHNVQQPRLPPFSFEVDMPDAGASRSGWSTRYPTRDLGTLPPSSSSSFSGGADYSFSPVDNETTNPARERDAFANLSGARSMRVRESHPTPSWVRHQGDVEPEVNDDDVNNDFLTDSITRGPNLRRRFDSIIRARENAARERAREREEPRRSADMPDVFDFMPNQQIVNRSRPRGSQIVDGPPDLFSFSDTRALEDDLTMLYNQYRPSLSAGSRHADGNSSRNSSARNPLPPPRSAGSRLQTATNVQLPLSGFEQDDQRPIRNSYEARSSVNLSLEASLRRRYPFLDEDPDSVRHTDRARNRMSRNHEGFTSGAVTGSAYSDAPNFGSQALVVGHDHRRPPSRLNERDELLEDVMHPQRQPLLQRQRTRSPARPPTLSLDLSFDSDLYPSFTAQDSASTGQSQAQTVGPSTSNARQAPSPAFIPSPPSPGLQLPSLHSSVFEPLANSPLFNFEAEENERRAPEPAVASTSGFVPINRTARNTHDSQTVNRFTWLQPERSPIDVPEPVIPEPQRLSDGGSIAQRAHTARNVWSLMDDEEILSPSDGLLSSVQSYNQEREEHRARVRSRIEGLTQSQESRNRESQSWRQAVENGRSRLTRIREMREAYRLSGNQRPETERRRPQSMLSAREFLTGDFNNSWEESVLGWDSNTFDDSWERGWIRTSPADEAAATSSTEAAAFFASGSSQDRERRPSLQLLRQRRLRMSGLDQASTFAPRERERSRVQPSQPRNAPTSRSANFGNGSEDMFRYLFGSRESPNGDARGREGVSARDPSIDSLFGEGMSASMDRMQSLRETVLNPPTQQAVQSPHPHDTTHSHPPILPPIQLLGESSSVQDLSEITSRFNVPERPAAQDHRRPSTTNESTLGWASLRPSTEQRGGDLAMHRALLLRSVQNRGIELDRNTQQQTMHTSTSATGVRPPGSFQQALDVMGADGLSLTRRQQFLQAHERTRDRERDREIERERERHRSIRPEPHVRWGEVRDDPESAGRPPAYRPIRARARRSSTSALFAPPSENADTTAPNRGSRGVNIDAPRNVGGETRTGGDVNSEEMFSLMAAGQRARQRHHLRDSIRNFGRDDTLSRSFFRRRQRTGLGSLGDFVRDEDFDASYESLIALAASLGDVKPRATPKDVLEALPNGLYKDWQSPGCDTRCPICLDDYKDVDPLLKAEPCNHWCHKDCFEQWLHTANTCPVCRTKIASSHSSARSPRPVAGPSGTRHTASSSSTAAALTGSSASTSASAGASSSTATSFSSISWALPTRHTSSLGTTNTSTATNMAANALTELGSDSDSESDFGLLDLAGSLGRFSRGNSADPFDALEDSDNDLNHLSF